MLTNYSVAELLCGHLKNPKMIVLVSFNFHFISKCQVHESTNSFKQKVWVFPKYFSFSYHRCE